MDETGGPLKGTGGRVSENGLGNGESSHNAQLPSFQIIENYTGTGRIHEFLFHRDSERGHSPVSLSGYFFQSRREELHPVAYVEHHAFLEWRWPVPDKLGFSRDAGRGFY